MAFRWTRGLGALRRLGAGAVVTAGIACPAYERRRENGVRMDSRDSSLEARVRTLETKLRAMELINQEEIRALETIKMAAKQHGLDIAGGTIRRTSSRFCLGVEHGDYNGTELFGVGTDRFIWMAYKPNTSGKIRIYSQNFPQEGVVEFAPGKVPPAKDPSISDIWGRFPYGVEHVLRKNGLAANQGFDAVLVGNIPGGGMSRSASLVLNLMLTMLDINKKSLPEGDFRVVQMAQQVENDYIGTPCGNLDQIMIYYAKDGMGTRYNPKTNKVSYVPLGIDTNEFCIAALDTGTVRHGLEKSTYAVRVKECNEFVAMLQKKGYKIQSLGDIKDRKTYDKIIAEYGDTHPNLCQRLEYLFFAQERFEAMVKAWTEGNIKEVGAIFRRDGIGLRDEYQISGPELETMVNIARTVPGVVGERMLGGGDKGASGAILMPHAETALRNAVTTGYKRSYPQLADKCAVHVVRVCKGVEVLEGLL
ncbi:unnamed protein product [Effrenium voratum]|nr:unnamed protein product [Effrenium voratum]|mmetsp:Transcript_71662/g.171125  ORF Transcript_71662/g.171125 Transcript_71662/m.171125 type:complete len:477 (+) Transcript_71662:80-1510(+)